MYETTHAAWLITLAKDLEHGRWLTLESIIDAPVKAIQLYGWTPRRLREVAEQLIKRDNRGVCELSRQSELTAVLAKIDADLARLTEMRAFLVAARDTGVAAARVDSISRKVRKPRTKKAAEPEM
jgi:hypothetical protein